MRASIYGLRVAILALSFYWIALFVGTHIPSTVLAKLHTSDKILHFGAFGGLAFLLAWAIPTNPLRMYQNVVWAAIIAIFYGCLDELTQIPVGRTADWADLAADAVGAVSGVIVYTIARAVIIAKRWNLLSSDED